MKLFHILLVLIAVTLLAVDSISAAGTTAPIFVLTRDDDGYHMESITVNEGETKVVPAGVGTDVIDLILPVGPGGSGAIVEGLPRNYIVTYSGGVISAQVVWESGRKQDLPSRPVDELKKYDSRVSVTGPDGAATNFIIRNYSRVLVDSLGPVMDMFAGRVELRPNDYSTVTNTTESEQAYSVEGEVAAVYSGKYLFVDAVLPSGRKGLFVIDAAAYSSLMVEAALPEGSAITESYMMEYSGGGVRQLRSTPGGATGAIESMLGTTKIGDLRLGDMVFEDLTVDVIKKLPLIDGRDVDGIIGLDLLTAARYMTIVYGTAGKPDSKLILSNTLPEMKYTSSMPYTDVYGLMYARGLVNGETCFFLLDTGAPVLHLSPEAAEQAKVAINLEDTVAYMGADGPHVTGHTGMIQNLMLNDVSFTDVPCEVGELFAVQGLGKGQLGGLLGNSAFSLFGAITFDYQDESLHFVSRK